MEYDEPNENAFIYRGNLYVKDIENLPILSKPPNQARYSFIFNIENLVVLKSRHFRISKEQ